MALDSSSFAMRASFPMDRPASLPAVPSRPPSWLPGVVGVTHSPAEGEFRGVLGGRSPPSARCSGGEEGEAGREPVEEVAGADWAEFPGAEAPRQGEGAEELVDDAGVVVGLAEEPLPPAVAGEEDGGVGLGRAQEIAEVLVGRA